MTHLGVLELGLLEQKRPRWHHRRSRVRTGSPPERLVASHRGSGPFKFQDDVGIDDAIGIGSGGSRQRWRCCLGRSCSITAILNTLVDGLHGWFWKQNFSKQMAAVGRNTSSLNLYPSQAILINDHLSPAVVLHGGAPG